MKTKALTALAIVALAAGVLAPVSSAQAATSTISGIVNYKGVPASNIVVGWVEPLTGSFDYVRSAPDGTYSIDGPEAGHKFVVYANLGMKNLSQTIQSYPYLGTFYGEGNERSYLYQTLTPYISGPSRSISVDLAKPGTISGQEPALAGYHLALQTVGGTPVTLGRGAIDTVVSNAGKFTIEYLVPGSYVLVNPTTKRFAGVRKTPIEVTEGTVTTVDPLVNYGRTITGTVTDSSGKRLPRVRVKAVSSGKITATRTNANGSYTLKLLSSSQYRVIAGGPEVSNTKLVVEKTVRVNGLATGEKRRVDIVVAIGGKVEGKIPSDNSTLVTISDNKDRVVLSWNSSSGDRLSFSGLPTGTYRLRGIDYADARYFSKKIGVKRGLTSSLGLLKPNKKTITISGTLSGKKPVDDDFVAAISSFGIVGVDYPLPGRYSISNVLPGSYKIVAYSVNRQLRVYAPATFTTSTTKNIAFGQPMSALRAHITLEGSAAPTGYIVYAFMPTGIQTEISKGRVSQRQPAGDYVVKVAVVRNAFPRSSPFWTTFPDTKDDFTVSSARDVDLGTVALVINGD